jgi:hypothetical protein
MSISFIIKKARPVLGRFSVLFRKTSICTINFDLLNYNKTAAEKSTAVRKTAI